MQHLWALTVNPSGCVMPLRLKLRPASESPREQGRGFVRDGNLLLEPSGISRHLAIPHAYELLCFRTLLFLLAPSLSSKTSRPVATAAAASWQVYGGATG